MIGKLSIALVGLCTALSAWAAEAPADFTAQVPLAISGKAPAEATGKGRLSQETFKLMFKCPAASIPDHIEIDVSGLATKGQTIHARDLKLPQGVTLAHKTEEDAVLVTVKSVHAAAETETTPQA